MKCAVGSVVLTMVLVSSFCWRGDFFGYLGSEYLVLVSTSILPPSSTEEVSTFGGLKQCFCIFDINEV